MRFVLETLLSGFDKFVDDIDVDLAELATEMVANNFIQFSENFSELGVKMVFHTIVRPILSAFDTFLANFVQYWPICFRFNHEVE